MSLFDRELLFGTIRPALRPLWEAYIKIDRESRSWIHETLAEVKDETAKGLTQQALERIAAEQLHAIAGCLVLLADNFAKAYIVDSGLPEGDRINYGGNVINGVKYGAALKAGADALRHYASWNGAKPFPQTAKVLADLGITRLDDSICFQILELDKVRNQMAYEARLDVLCQEVDQVCRSPKAKKT